VKFALYFVRPLLLFPISEIESVFQWNLARGNRLSLSNFNGSYRKSEAEKIPYHVTLRVVLTKNTDRKTKKKYDGFILDSLHVQRI
jgi:hypothetical protein